MTNGKSPFPNLQPFSHAQGRSRLSGDALAILFLIFFPFIYFWQVTLGQGVWLTTDILRLFYPFSVELARALNEGRLPLWTPNLLAGFPLLAEGQVGALYPINWLLYKFFPTHYALSFNILLHIAWAALGMYVFVRSHRIGIAGALLAGFVFSFNGVILGQMFHPPILFAVAWLPWLIFLVAQFQTARGKARATWFVFAVLALGVQFLCGSTQMAFLNALAVVVFGVFGPWVWENRRLENVSVTARNLSPVPFRFGGYSSQVEPRSTCVGWMNLLPRLESLLQIFLLLALAGGIAAIQLIPTGELIGYSVRGGTLGQEFVTSYSMPPEYLAQFGAPFAQGEPAEGNEEYRAYLGIPPLMLALGALVLKRNRQTLFFAVIAFITLSFALGELNPLYQLLYRLPLFNFFRVPARYLYLVVFAVAFLSAVALDARLVIASTFDPLSVNSAKQSPPRSLGTLAPHASAGVASSQKSLLAMTWHVVTLLLFALLTFGTIVLGYIQPLAFWLEAWQVLPILFGLATLGMVALAWTRRIARGTFATAILGLTILDLVCYAPPFLKTIDVLTPTAGVTTPPRSVQALSDDLTRGRIFTDDSTFPSPPAIRNSLFPNTALLYGEASAQIYSSLAFGRHQTYVYNASPAMLNLLNVRYVMIPLEPRPQTKSALPNDALASDLVRGEITFEPTNAQAIQIVSATEQAANLANSTPIAEIVVFFDDGTDQILPLRVGVETADWDYERKRADNAISHALVPIAHSFPAYWRAYGRTFEGHTFITRYEFASPRKIVGIHERVLHSDARLMIESLMLETHDQTVSLARLVGKNDFVLAYMSDTVAAWENRSVLSRAFVVHAAQVLDDSAAFVRLRDPVFDPAGQVLLSDGNAQRAPSPPNDRVEITGYQSDRVTIHAATNQPGYLVLTDSWYPGWRVFVDSQPAPIYRADVLFRAVQIEPGTHTIVFEYQPESFLIGVIVSVTSFIILMVYLGMSIGRK